MKKRSWLIVAVVPVLLFTIYGVLGRWYLPYWLTQNLPAMVQKKTGMTLQWRAIQINPFALSVTLDDLSLVRNQSPLMSAHSIYVNADLTGFLERGLRLADLQMTGLVVMAGYDAQGRLNWASEQTEPAPTTQDAAHGEALPRLWIDHLTLNDGAIMWHDQRQGDVELALKPITFSVDHLSTLHDSSGTYQFDAMMGEKTHLHWQGSFGLQPIASRGEFAVTDLALATVWPLLAAQSPLHPASGNVQLKAAYTMSMDQQLQLALSSLQFSVQDLELKKQQDSVLKWIDLQGAGTVDVDAHEVSLTQLDLDGMNIKIRKSATGEMDWTRFFPSKQDEAPGLPWHVAMSAVKLKGGRAQLIDHSQQTPSVISIADIGASLPVDLVTGKAMHYRIAPSSLHLKSITLAAELDASNRLEIADIAFDQLSVDSATPSMSAERLHLGLGDNSFSPDTLGTLAQQKLLTPVPQQNPVPSPLWQIDIHELDLEGTVQHWHDARKTQVFDFDVASWKAQISPLQLNNPAAQKAPPTTVSAHAEFVTKGSVDLKLSGDLASGKVQGQIDVNRVAMTPFTPFLQDSLLASIGSGYADVHGRFRNDGDYSKMRLQLNAGVAIDQFQLLANSDHKPVVSWLFLAISDLQWQSHPVGKKSAQLQIHDVDLIQPFAVAHVFRDKHTSMDELLVKHKPASSDVAAPMTMQIAQVRIHDGQLDFSDDSLVLPYAAHIAQFEGTINGIDSDPATRAHMQLQGRINPYGSAKIDGAMQLFSPLSKTDIHAVFDNVDLPRMSPYSATFAGRQISDGRLAMDLQYHIVDGKMDGDNHVILDRFSLGDRVESPNAMSVPLDLVVAMLTDGDGKIDLSLPISGDINDPDFHYGTVVWQVVKNLMVKAVSSPFRLLAHLFGGSEDDEHDKLQFDPGSASLPPPESEKLAKVVQGLQQRPQLQLQIQPSANRENDKSLLADYLLRRELLQRLNIPVSDDITPIEPVYDEAPTQRELENMAALHLNETEINALVKEKTKGKNPPKRISLLPGVLGGGAGDADFYQALFQHMVAKTGIADAQLTALADARGKTVLNELPEDMRTRTQVLSSRIVDHEADMPNALMVVANTH